MEDQAYSPQDNQYPRMLYREGTTFEWGGRTLDHCLVDDAEQEAAAIADGWHLTPDGVGEAHHAAVTSPDEDAPTVEDQLNSLRAELAETKARLAAAEAAPAPTPTPAPAPAEDPRIALRAEYKELAGKDAFNGWSAEELQKRIGELKAKASEPEEIGSE